jgi:hypothetical protein
MAGETSSVLVPYRSPLPWRQHKMRRLSNAFLEMSRRFVAPSPVVLHKIGPVDQGFLSFYVEADGVLVDEATTTTYDNKSAANIGCLRALRLGWVQGAAGKVSEAKERLIAPRRPKYEIATTIHGVSEEVAEGHCCTVVEVVLNEFMADVLTVTTRGGRLLCEDLSLHGGIIEVELERCSMTALSMHWGHAMRCGLTLVDPAVGRWLLESHNAELTQDDHSLPMRELLRYLLPEYDCAPYRLRTAVDNAALALEISRALHRLTVPPCQRPGGRHAFKKVFMEGLRDNNEFYERCYECGLTI